MYDFLVVGAGFAGCTIAERLASRSNKKVLLIDKRSHLGGNAYDYYDDHGILIHKYGPHIFHTNSESVFKYLSKFTEWRHYEHRVLAYVNKSLVPIPINLKTINSIYGWNLDSIQLQQYFDKIREPILDIRTSEDVIVNQIGRDLYELFYKNYTKKQWNLYPSQLDKSVTSRIPIRTDVNDRYFNDKYQVMPSDGYSKLFANMVDNKNITVLLDTEYEGIKEIRYKTLIYTGSVDEFFDYKHGKLPYRSLRFKHKTFDKEVFQPVGVINYPNDHKYTRVTEYKHLTGQISDKTTVTYEYPTIEGDPYYPIPTAENKQLYHKYKVLTSSIQNTFFIGRLGSYQYYNMDQVVAQALKLFAKLR